MFSIWFLGYMGAGIVSGLMAGLLGVGGGIILVPLTVMLFTAANLFPEAILMKMALATSMSAIMFTSVSSMRVHHSLGNVMWKVVRAIVPGVAIGALIGTFIVRIVSSVWLTWFFAVFVIYISVKMLLNVKAKPSRTLPGNFGLGVFGTVVGCLSVLLSAGGGFLTVPFLNSCNVDMRKSIGTSAALGFPIALFGTLGYIISGWSHTNLSDYCLGYVYLPALFGIVLMSVLFAPVGAYLSQRLPVTLLKRIFAIILIATAIKLLSNVW